MNIHMIASNSRPTFTPLHSISPHFTPQHLSTSSDLLTDTTMADLATEWRADILRIQHTAQALNEAGNVLKSLRNDLESRLVLAWGESADLQDQSTTAWRKRNAQNIYQEVQDENHHLFLAFILAMGPTACSRTGFKTCVQALLKADRNGRQKLQLNREAKELFESTALRRQFAGNARYVNFMKSLFPEGLQGLIVREEAHS